METPRWKFDGVRVIHGCDLDPNTPQTAGMNRAAAVTTAEPAIAASTAATVPPCPAANPTTDHTGR